MKVVRWVLAVLLCLFSLFLIVKLAGYLLNTSLVGAGAGLALLGVIAVASWKAYEGGAPSLRALGRGLAVCVALAAVFIGGTIEGMELSPLRDQMNLILVGGAEVVVAFLVLHALNPMR